MADVFIGYAAEDENVAKILSDALEDVGISVWYAGRDIEPGDVWAISITEEIKRCRAFVLILSKSGVRSSFLLEEMRYAEKARHEGAGIALYLPLALDREGKSALSERIVRGNVWFDATVPPLQDRLREFARWTRERLRHPQESAS